MSGICLQSRDLQDESRHERFVRSLQSHYESRSILLEVAAARHRVSSRSATDPAGPPCGSELIVTSVPVVLPITIA